jgi:hypothetical protein
VKAKQRLDSSVHFAPLANVNAGETAYENGKVTATGVSFAITDTTLLEKGGVYSAKLGLAMLDENGKFSAVNTVALDGGNARPVTYESGELALTVDGEFILPKNLCEGQYALVVYVATEDGLRISEYKKLTMYAVNGGALQSEAMAVTVENAEDTLLVHYKVQLSVQVAVELGRAYTGEEMEREMLRVALAQGYPKDGERLKTESGEDVDLQATLGAGTYRMKIYLPTADGISEAYVYCRIEETTEE